MKSLAPIVNDYDLVHKLYVDGKFLSGLTTNGNNLQYTINGVDKLLTVPYATNAEKLGDVSASNYNYRMPLVYGQYNRLFSFRLKSGEKGQIVFRVTESSNGGNATSLYTIYWGYTSTITDEKAINLRCLYSQGYDRRTSVYAVRRTTSLDGSETIVGAFDIFYNATSTSMYGSCEILSYASNVEFLTRAPILATSDDIANYAYRSSSTTMYGANWVGNASSATYTTNARITNTEPTGGSTYYPTFVSGITANTNYPFRANDTISYRLFEGTADTAGVAGLWLGNATASGTAGNAFGYLRLYGTNTGYTELRAKSQTGNYAALYLPSANGTLVHHTTGTAIGSANAPVYVDSTGKVTACSGINYLASYSTKNTETASFQLAKVTGTPEAELDAWNSPFGVFTHDDGSLVDFGSVLRVRYSSTYYTDFWIDANSTENDTIAYRRVINNNIHDWARILTDKNFATTLDSSYVKKSGDTMTGMLKSQHILPSTTGTYECGASGNRWSKVYSVNGNFSGQITSSVATGTAPFVVASKTLVSNLNADLLDGYHESSFFRDKVWVNNLDANQQLFGSYRGNSFVNVASGIGQLIAFNNVEGNYQGGQLMFAHDNQLYSRIHWNGSFGAWKKVAFTDSNVATASKLQTARTIALTGAVTGTATSFDGSANISIPTTNVDANYVGGYFACTYNKHVYYGHHPECSTGIIPFLYNDLAHLVARGGSCTIYKTTDTDYTQPTLTNAGAIGSDYTQLFDGCPNYWSYTVSSLTDVVVADITLPTKLAHGTQFYIDFGTLNWRAKNVSVYVWNDDTENSEQVFTSKGSITDNDKSAFRLQNIGYRYTNTSGTSVVGFNRLRVVLTNFATTTPRIAQIGLINFSSIGLRYGYMSRGIDDQLHRSLTPAKSVTYSLGSSNARWNRIYGNTLDLSGSIYLPNNGNIYEYLYDGSTYVSLMSLSTINNLLIGQGVAKSGYSTYICGNSISLCYGTTGSSNQTGLKLSSEGNILTTLNKFICTSETDTWAHKYTDADGNEQTIELPHYGYVINTNPANYIGGGFLSSFFGLNFHVGSDATKIRFGHGDAASETWTTTLTGGGALTLAQSASIGTTLRVKGASALTGVVYTGTTLYTHGKTATTDGKAGNVLGNGFISIVGATPYINFYYGNSTSSTSTIKETSAGTLAFTGTTANPHKLQLMLGDATAKFYAVDIDSSNYGNESVALQTCFDNKDPEASDFTTSHEARCNLLLQPRGGQVYVGYTPTDYQTTYALSVGGNMRLYGSQSDSPELLFYRDGLSSWKIINTAGKLIFRNNYTTAVQSSYFDVLTLSYNSGNATLKGQLTTGSHILPSTHEGASIGQTAQRWARGYFVSGVNVGAANSASTSGDSNTTIGAGIIELSHSTPFIDFHYNNSTADYTSRIIEGLSGQLTVWGKLRVGLSYSTSTDYNFHVVGTAYASTSITTPTGNITTVNATTVNATTLRRIQSAASTVPTIWVSSGNYDNTVLRVDYSKSTNYYGDYGFTLKYMGTGNGYQNNLNLYADNTTVATQNIAWSVNQLGQVAIRTAATNTSYDLYVNSTAYIPTLTVTEMKIGDATITWDSTNNALKIDKSVYSTGGVSALGYSETTSDGNGGGIVSTVLSEYNLINTTLTEDVTVVASAYATKRIYNSVKSNTTNISTLQTNYSAMSTTVNSHTSMIDMLNSSQFYSSGDASTGLTLTWFTQSGGGRSVTIPTWNSLGQTWNTYDGTPCLISSWLFDDIVDMINTYAVTGIGTSGSYLTYTKNGTTTNVTVPYASYSGYSNSVKSTVPTSTTTAYATGYLKSYYAGGSNTVTNKPTGVDAFGMISMQTAGGYTGQILISANTNVDMYWKTGASGSLSSVSWRKLLDDSNTSFTQTLTSGREIGTITIGGTSTKIYAPSGSTISVINVLTSTSTTSALSAYQGKVLNDKFANYLTTSEASNTYMPKAGGDFSGDVCLYDSDVYGSENDYEYWRITYLGAATFATVNGYTLGTACAKSFTTSVTSGSTSLVTSGAVYTALANQKTSFTQTLTSGTEIGTITVGSSSTTLYAPTSTSSSTYDAATTTTLGLVKVGAVRTSEVTTNSATSTSLRYYKVEMDSNNVLFVNVPWTYTNTTTTTASSNKTATKLFLVGATSQSSSGVTTYSNAGVYIGTDNKLYANNGITVGSDSSYEGTQTFSGTIAANGNILLGYNSAYGALYAKSSAGSNLNLLQLTSDTVLNVGYGVSTVKVNGTISCTTLTQTSDVRYKNILGDVTLTTSQIANAPAVYFTWNSGDDTTTRQIGTTAQYWRQYVPEATVDIEGRYGLNYSALALVSTVVIARSVETHEQRITRLEERIKVLEEENKELINKLNNM